MIYLKLFLEFFKAGLFAVGGGLATLPFIQDISNETGWFDSMDISNMIAVSESTPGPLGVNMSTYVGFITGGLFGGIIVTFALVLPSIIIIIIISNFLKKFKDSVIVQNVFYGLRPASTALITVAGIGVTKIAFMRLEIFDISSNISSVFKWESLFVAAVLWILLNKCKLHPIFYIALSAIIGIILQLDTIM